MDDLLLCYSGYDARRVVLFICGVDTLGPQGNCTYVFSHNQNHPYLLPDVGNMLIWKTSKNRNFPYCQDPKITTDRNRMCGFGVFSSSLHFAPS